MIFEAIFEIISDTSQTAKSIFCSMFHCAPSFEWRWLPEKLNFLDLIAALGALGSFLAVIGAAIAISQSAKARNLSTVVELTRQLSAEREKAHGSKIYGMSDADFHAYQMVHLVEQAAMLVNNGWVSGQSKDFLLDWLRMEIPSMAKQEAYRAVFSNVEGRELCELFKLRDQFETELKNELAEKKKAEHFERIAERRRSGRGW